MCLAPFDLFASIFRFFSNSFDLFPEYGQSRIYAHSFRQFLVSPNSHSQFRVQFIEHDCSHLVFVLNRLFSSQ